MAPEPGPPLPSRAEGGAGHEDSPWPGGRSPSRPAPRLLFLPWVRGILCSPGARGASAVPGRWERPVCSPVSPGAAWSRGSQLPAFSRLSQPCVLTGHMRLVCS